jgi:histidyl-tRNA synthetase
MRARLALVVGENEVRDRRVQLKVLATGQQQEVAEADLVAKVQQLID